MAGVAFMGQRDRQVSGGAMTDRIYRYWPLGVPLPDGWELAGELHPPHGAYSVLIEWTKGGEPPEKPRHGERGG